MFNVTQPTDQSSDQSDDQAKPAQAGQPIGGSLLERLSDAEARIYLPRGTAQSRCEPPSYYYLASDSGAVPSWAVDEACRKRLRNGVH
jgi:hypothetical protein